MGNKVAYDRGDARAIWLVLDGKLEELTPLENDHYSASLMAKGLNQRFYFKRHGDRWSAHDTHAPGWTAQGRTFPTQDAALMFAIHRSAR